MLGRLAETNRPTHCKRPFFTMTKVIREKTFITLGKESLSILLKFQSCCLVICGVNPTNPQTGWYLIVTRNGKTDVLSRLDVYVGFVSTHGNQERRSTLPFLMFTDS